MSKITLVRGDSTKHQNNEDNLKALKAEGWKLQTADEAAKAKAAAKKAAKEAAK